MPADWVDTATARQTSNGSNPNSDWDQGFGYQFWQCRHGAYRRDGAFGQFCPFLPDHDTVVAITSGTDNMQGVMNVVWESPLPALAPVALTEDADAHSALSFSLSLTQLELPSLQGDPFEKHATTHLDKTYAFAKNPHAIEELAIIENDGIPHIGFKMNGKGASMQDIGLALSTRLDAQSSAETVTQTAWASSETLISRTYYTHAPYALTLTLIFKDKTLSLQPEWNVAFGPKNRTQCFGWDEASGRATSNPSAVMSLRVKGRSVPSGN